VNTAQYGRTFQDRTHVFYIQKRPENVQDKTLQLITVQGKRGNIVQTFPGTEYFFVPQITHVMLGDAVHFGWSGSNTNPNNNDGQGKQGTDRSNVVALKNSNYVGAETEAEKADGGTILAFGALVNNYPAFVATPEGYDLPNPEVARGCTKPDHVAEPMAGFSQSDLNQLATGRRLGAAKTDTGNMEELDDTSSSFAMEPLITKATGCHAYMSTRNNNFSNRSQKGLLCVGTGNFLKDTATQAGATLETPTGFVNIAKGQLIDNVMMTVQTWQTKENPSSNTMLVEPIEMNSMFMSDDSMMEIGVPFTLHAFMKPVMYHKVSETEEWKSCDAEFKYVEGEYTAEHMAHEGGWYEVHEEVDAGAVIAILIAALVVIAIIGFICFRKMTKSPLDEESRIAKNGEEDW